MSLLTKCGLLPTLTNTNSYEKKINEQSSSQVIFDNIVTLAPFGFRPFAGYQNPYRNGCSILCNHPSDQDTRYAIKKTKEILEHKCQTYNFNYTEDEIYNIPLPEALIRRYTETDSRPPTPIVPAAVTSTTSCSSAKLHNAAPIVDADNNIQDQRTKLILDLQKNFDQNTTSSLKENEEFYNPLCTMASKKIIHKEINVKYKSESQIQRQKYKPKKKADKKDNDNDTKNNVNCTLPINVDFQAEKIKNSVSLSKMQQPKTQKSKPKHSRKVKQKFKFLKKDTSKEVKELPDPEETQIVSCDSGKILNAELDDTKNIQKQDDNLHIQESEYEKDKYRIDIAITRELHREFYSRMSDTEFDPKKRKVLEEIQYQSTLNKLSDYDRKKKEEQLSQELEMKPSEINVEQLFTLPRLFSRKNARFEIPLNKNDLKNMTILQYLETYVYITSKSHLLYNEVFKIHAECDTNNTSILKTQEIKTALSQIMARNFNENEKLMLFDLLEIQENTRINYRLWCGICALCERILEKPSYLNNSSIEGEDDYHEVELADFEVLKKNRNILDSNPKLEFILFKIGELNE